MISDTSPQSAAAIPASIRDLIRERQSRQAANDDALSKDFSVADCLDEIRLYSREALHAAGHLNHRRARRRLLQIAERAIAAAETIEAHAL